MLQLVILDVFFARQQLFRCEAEYISGHMLSLLILIIVLKLDITEGSELIFQRLYGRLLWRLQLLLFGHQLNCCLVLTTEGHAAIVMSVDSHMDLLRIVCIRLFLQLKLSDGFFQTRNLRLGHFQIEDQGVNFFIGLDQLCCQISDLLLIGLYEILVSFWGLASKAQRVGR